MTSRRTATATGTGRPNPLLRWGLPRDPVATRHLAGFLVTTVVTVVVTRALLAATGFPQLGGEGLHIAHVLWGGLLMGVAMLALVSFAGPVVRPIGAFVGGVGFGLFIDEIGKFLTDDNDYFFAPAPALMYVTLVALMLAADWLHRRRPHHPAEHLAGAADYAVAGLVGGLSERARADAHRLLDLGRAAPQSPEVEALLAAVEHDEDEIVDPIDAAWRRFTGFTLRVARGGWSTAVTVVLVLTALAVVFVVVLGSWEQADDLGLLWLVAGALVSAIVSLAMAAWGLWRLRTDRVGGYLWLRRAVLLNLLVAQVAVFRFEPWWATAGLAACLGALGVIAAERWRLRIVASV